MLNLRQFVILKADLQEALAFLGWGGDVGAGGVFGMPPTGVSGGGLVDLVEWLAVYADGFGDRSVD